MNFLRFAGAVFRNEFHPSAIRRSISHASQELKRVFTSDNVAEDFYGMSCVISVTMTLVAEAIDEERTRLEKAEYRESIRSGTDTYPDDGRE